MKWSIQSAAIEFGVSRETIRRGFVQLGIDIPKTRPKTGEAKKWTTKQITQAIFGDIRSERLRETRARADLLELKRREREGDLVPSGMVQAVLAEVLTPLRTRLLSAPATIAARANPGDPELARKTIHAEITQILQDAADATARAT